MLTVRVLGSPEITRDGRPVRLPRRKSRALLFYLAAQGAPVRRDSLLALFWPDAERAAARQTLRTTVHGLRQLLGPALLADNETLALAPEVLVDARQFEAGLNAAGDAPALNAALAHYQGDFLNGFSLPDAPGFDDWAAVERERLRRLAVRGLTALSRQHESAQDFAAALAALERALAFDSLQEDLQRAALRLHYLAGDRAGAIRRYDALRRLLDEEMGVPPMAETRALYDAILADALEKSQEPRPTGQSPKTKTQAAARIEPLGTGHWELGFAPPFTGRAAELQALAAARERRALALIEGEPGIGKSRLAEEFLRSAGGLALTGAARELETALPYQPIREALRGLLVRPDWVARREQTCKTLPSVWRTEAVRLFPDLDPEMTAPPDAADESRLWEGVFQLLTALAGPETATLFLDDLQWADASTLSLLGYLIRRAEMARAPLRLLGATRVYAPRSPLAILVQALSREGRLARVALTRLSPDDVVSLAHRLSPDFARPLAIWLQRNSEGNPYILTELVRTLNDRGLLRPDGALNPAALPDSPVVPGSVYQFIQSRLERLSEPARRVLDAAVAAGREFEFDVVARAAGLSEAAALDALDELRQAHLALPAADGRHFVFDHTLTMEVAYQEVGDPRHRLLHRRVAEALEDLGRDRSDAAAGLLAWHFTEGGAPERAARYAYRAGQQAARLAAWPEAIAFYEQALAAASGRPRQAVLLALGEARFQAGHAAQAAETLQALLAEASLDAAQRDAARLLLAQTRLNQARYADVIALAQELLAESTGTPERAVAAELLWGTALSLEGTDLNAAVQHLQRAENVLQSSPEPDPARLAQARFELGSVAAQQGDLPRAVALYRQALAVADAHEALKLWRALGCNNLAYHLHLLGDPEADEYLQRGLALAREAGLLNILPFLLSTQGEIALTAGDLAAAEAAFAEALSLAEQFSVAERVAGALAGLGRAAARRGDTALAVHRLSTALARAEALGTQHLAAQVRLWLAPLLPPAEARAALAEARAIAASGGRRRLLAEAEALERQLGLA